MKFQLNTTITKVDIIPFDEETYKTNPHRKAFQFHRIEFYGDNDNLVGVIATSAWDGKWETGFLNITESSRHLEPPMPEQKPESVAEVMKLIEGTELTLIGTETYCNGIQYLVEAPGGSTYSGFLTRVQGGFEGEPRIPEMFDEDKYRFFSTALKEDVEKDRMILENFDKVSRGFHPIDEDVKVCETGDFAQLPQGPYWITSIIRDANR